MYHYRVRPMMRSMPNHIHGGHGYPVTARPVSCALIVQSVSSFSLRDWAHLVCCRLDCDRFGRGPGIARRRVVGAVRVLPRWPGHVIRVRLAAVLAHVEAHLLVLRGAAQHVELLKQEEEGRHNGHHPSDDAQDAHHRTREELAATAEEGAIVLALAVGLLDVGLAREKGGRDESPRAAGEVHRARIHDVVHLQNVAYKRGPGRVHARAHHANGHGGPRINGGAARGDGHEAREGTVERVQQVKVVQDELGKGEVGDRARRSGNSGCGRSKGDNFAETDDAQRRARVEAVPAHPEDEGAQCLERGRVPRDIDDVALGIKSAQAGPHKEGTEQRTEAAHHVHRAAAGKVNHAHAEEGRTRGPEGGEPALGGPLPVHHHGVDEHGEHGAVPEVGAHASALRHCA
mmetsp:Transcript_15770/g.42384  ORF Transcript_15770/g.42384 Transcript_15770/m.42384 type:complete len:402 (+) Transcript_15770:182-1387(+)